MTCRKRKLEDNNSFEEPIVKKPRLERVKLVRHGNRWVKIDPFTHQQLQQTQPTSTETPPPTTAVTTAMTTTMAPTTITEVSVCHQPQPSLQLDINDINFDPLLTTIHQQPAPLLQSDRNVFDFLNDTFPIVDSNDLLL